MKSKTRQDSDRAELIFMEMIQGKHDHIKSPQMLYVGVAGNPITHNGKPGPDHPSLYTKYRITTLDFDSKWNPDVVGDITKPEVWMDLQSVPNGYDLIHIVQTIEHIPNIFNLGYPLWHCSSHDGYVIVDCPWGPNGPDYHGEAGSFGDYWRISKDGMKALFERYFDIQVCIATDANTSCLMKSRKYPLTQAS